MWRSFFSWLFNTKSSSYGNRYKRQRVSSYNNNQSSFNVYGVYTWFTYAMSYMQRLLLPFSENHSYQYTQHKANMLTDTYIKQQKLYNNSNNNSIYYSIYNSILYYIYYIELWLDRYIVYVWLKNVIYLAFLAMIIIAAKTCTYSMYYISTSIIHRTQQHAE